MKYKIYCESCLKELGLTEFDPETHGVLREVACINHNAKYESMGKGFAYGTLFWMVFFFLFNWFAT